MTDWCLSRMIHDTDEGSRRFKTMSILKHAILFDVDGEEARFGYAIHEGGPQKYRY